MSEELNWRAALDVIDAGGEVVDIATDTIYRLDGDVLRSKKRGGEWLVDASGFAWLRSRKWRRVPKTPSLGELAPKWRERTEWSCTSESQRKICATELDAALREGEWVDLRGVTAQELWEVWHACDAGSKVSMQAVLDHLRKRAVKT